MGVAFRELPGGRSRWRLPQSRDRGLKGSTHCGFCVHGSHLLPTATIAKTLAHRQYECPIGIMPTAVSRTVMPRIAGRRGAWGWRSGCAGDCEERDAGMRPSRRSTVLAVAVSLAPESGLAVGGAGRDVVVEVEDVAGVPAVLEGG